MSKVKPVIIKRNTLKTLNSMSVVVQEDIIYRATPNDFLKGKYPNLVICNEINKLNNSSKTKAKFSNNNSSVVELTSDAITQLIGQKSYDLVLTALCSVFNQDLKIKAILSLLTTKKIVSSVAGFGPKLAKYNVATQTDQSCMALLMKDKQRRNRRSRVAKPYVITDQLTKVIIHPNEIKSKSIHKNQVKQENYEQDLPNLKLMDEELSNASWGSTSNLSILSENIPNKVLDPQFMLNNIDRHTEDKLANPISSTINAPEDEADQELSNAAYHFNTRSLLNNDSLVMISSEDKQKLIIKQALIDFRSCVQRNEDYNLPIHQAVLEDDVSMLRRHCIMLTKRGESIDKLSSSHLTALQISIFHDSIKCMEVLLQYGADVFVADDDGRTCFHLAAEKDTDHLKLLVEHCKKKSCMVLEQNEDLWKAFCERKSDKGITEILLHSISILCDSQGYTPLMLASKSGVVQNVKLLVEISPDTINMKMPNCGNSALYLAVAAACLDAQDCDDKFKLSDNYLQTVETLIVNGGDPFSQNNSGSSVNELLCDSTVDNPKGYLLTLSSLIANKLTSVKYFKGENVKNFDKYMLLKNSQGNISITDINKKGDMTTNEIVKSISVASDNNTSATLPINNESDVGATIGSNINAEKPIILYKLPMVDVNQVLPVPLKNNNTNKKKYIQPNIEPPPFFIKKPASKKATVPLILQRRKRNNSKNELKIGQKVEQNIIIPSVPVLPKASLPKPNITDQQNEKNEQKLEQNIIVIPSVPVLPIASLPKPNITDQQNENTLKFVKILPKVVSDNNIQLFTATKRPNSDGKSSNRKRNKKIKINPLNT